ncbi:MAG: urease subunit beta [Alphaproteobacteria bacterium]|jgi:urease subunit beta|nr:MAG: urease subunit beta [Alphaproteobacteria bacterium]|tara:strand:- start:5056 stop:5370 length:315 start_codon:yes stop_codon:yes gene_type:complete
MIPGEYIVLDEKIELNADSVSNKIIIENTGDRPIQVGSHYHFYEVNEYLNFDRKLTYGRRLNIPSGTAIRFEPGQSREVELIPYKGKKNIFGFNALINNKLKEV